ncbi:hypothetical protein FRB94_008633 [Tulasnella sp. JGI-2019a]|nr:hypothetical protein FRB94_008633 [Tulasnella sp. JGI-2019a]KAG9035516.1 hypothetical protein FRB95_011222 [Tulasnella sp. JGI-2019a]
MLLRCLRQHQVSHSRRTVLILYRFASSHTTQETTPRATRARNLSARYAPRASPPAVPLNSESNRLRRQTEEATQIGLSSQGLSNLKSVQAAARLSEYASGSEGGGPASDTNSKLHMTIGDLTLSIPEKPEPPGPEDCCMSGCAVCVHDLYMDALQSYQSSLRETRDNLTKRFIPRANWPKVILALKDEVDAAGIPSDIDPATRAFMLLEQNLKKKKI